MSLALKSTVELDKEQLATIIEQYLRREGYDVLSKVSFTVEKQTQGYGMNEHDELVFTGARVQVKPTQKIDYTGLGNQMSQPVEPR